MSQSAKSSKNSKNSKNASQAQSAKPAQSGKPAQAGKPAQSGKPAQPSQPVKSKSRSTLLTIALVLVILHGIFMAFFYWTVIPDAQRTWSNIVLWVMLLTAVADIIAAAAMWYWKRWGIYLYGIAAVASAVVAVLMTGDLFLVFGALLPAIIVLYIVMRHRTQFE
jgi:peptidoglycan/LPS O-acetylase OafA/YrhL